MTPQSAKAKGRSLQKWLVEKLVEILGCDPEDVESRSMGAGGEDIVLGVDSRRKFPFSVECKNQERLNVWAAYEQACANAKTYTPLVVIKKNRKKPLVVLDAETFLSLVSKPQ
jgi:hypothetical protein